MRLEDQVCSFELAKKLKELGVDQDTYFWYGTVKYRLFNEIRKQVIFCEADWEENEMRDYSIECSAFTASELFNILPWESEESCLKLFRTPKYFNISYKELSHHIFDENLSNALAKMLIYLIENNLFLMDKKGI